MSLVQWTGATRPYPKAMEITAKLGLPNINGGDPRYDSKYPSLAYLSPLSRKVGKYRQIYSSASNENTYTGLWKGPFFGYKYLVETL